MQKYIKPKRRISCTVDVLVYGYEYYDDLYLAYCPVLDIYGYGYGVDGALRSFRAVAKSFFVYVFHRGTLYDELCRLGWTIRLSSYEFIQPVVDTDLYKKQYPDMQTYKVEVEIIVQEHVD